MAIILLSSYVVFNERTSTVTNPPAVLSEVVTTVPTFPTPIRHVIIIVMENAEYSSVIGNSTSTPYQNMLSTKYALAGEYFATTHPSLPNYLSLVAGSYFGISSDCQPNECSQSGKSIVDLLNQRGFSWKEYAESMPTNCSQTISGLYYPKHNPFVYFTDITGNYGSGQTSQYCKSHVIPLTQLSIDLVNNALPNYSFITPNICDDAHDCSLAAGDNWLRTLVPQIINSPEFSSSVLFIVYDEGTTNFGVNGSQGGGHVACIVVSPFVKKGYRSTTQYSHYSLLATDEAIFNLGNLGENDAKAQVMQDLFTITL